MFSLNDLNQMDWHTPYRGLEAVLTFHNVALGLSVFFLARLLGLLYFIYTIDHDLIVARSRKHLYFTSLFFLVFFLYFLIGLLLKDGFAVNPETGEVVMENYKYLHNLLEMPVIAILLVVGILGVLWGIITTIFLSSNKGFRYAGAGTVLTVLSLFLIAGFNNTAFYPSVYDLQSSLTIQNASSSKYTLTAMSYVSLLIPFVLAYIYYFWKAINRKKISDDEMNNESHVY